MEESAIREGFAHLKPSTEYDALYNAPTTMQLSYQNQTNHDLAMRR